MRFRRFLVRMIGYELIGSELVKLVFRGVRSYQDQLQEKMASWLRQSMVLLVLLSLLRWAAFFGLFGLSVYLNARLGNPYQGFLIVSGGCASLLLFLGLLARWR